MTKLNRAQLILDELIKFELHKDLLLRKETGDTGQSFILFHLNNLKELLADIKEEK